MDDVIVVDVTDPADPRLDDFRDLNSVDRRPDLELALAAAGRAPIPTRS